MDHKLQAMKHLQYIHDRIAVSYWKPRLQDLAKRHNLTWKDEHEAL